MLSQRGIRTARGTKWYASSVVMDEWTAENLSMALLFPMVMHSLIESDKEDVLAYFRSLRTKR